MSKSNGNSVTKLTRICLAPLEEYELDKKTYVTTVTKQQINTMKAIYTQLQEMQTELYMLTRVLDDDYDPRMPKNDEGGVVPEAEEASELLEIANKMVARAQREITGWLDKKGKLKDTDFDKIIEAVGKRYNEYI